MCLQLDRTIRIKKIRLQNIIRRLIKKHIKQLDQPYYFAMYICKYTLYKHFVTGLAKVVSINIRKTEDRRFICQHILNNLFFENLVM